MGAVIVGAVIVGAVIVGAVIVGAVIVGAVIVPLTIVIVATISVTGAMTEVATMAVPSVHPKLPGGSAGSIIRRRVDEPQAMPSARPR